MPTLHKMACYGAIRLYIDSDRIVIPQAEIPGSDNGQIL